MYHYPEYREDRVDRLLPVIEAHPLGLLVSCTDGRFAASHLPFLAEPSLGGRWRLLAHCDAANPQVADLDGASAYAVFSGPNAYISPNAYVTRQLPTWNYVAVHAVGRCRIERPGLDILDDIARLTAHSEPDEGAWVLDTSEQRVRRLAPLVCRVILDVDRMEGRFKLSQEKGPADRSAACQRLVAQTPAAQRRDVEALCARQGVVDEPR